MEKPYIKCRECFYTEKLSTNFLFKYCRKDILELCLKAFPGSLMAMIVGILFPDSTTGKQLIHIINKKYVCPKCGKNNWIALIKD